MIFTIFAAFTLIGCNVVDNEEHANILDNNTNEIDTTYLDTIHIDTVKIDSTPLLTYFITKDTITIRWEHIFLDERRDSALVILFTCDNSYFRILKSNKTNVIEYAIDRSAFVNKLSTCNSEDYIEYTFLYNRESNYIGYKINQYELMSIIK